MKCLWRGKIAVKYLLKHAKELKKISINFDKHAPGDALDQDMIENIPKGSDKCEIQFVRHVLFEDDRTVISGGFVYIFPLSLL